MSASWDLIGTALGLENNDLQSMARANIDDIRRLNDVLDKWIQMDGQASPITWCTIIKVIQGPIVNNNELANKIFQSLKEKEYKQTTTSSKYIQCIL